MRRLYRLAPARPAQARHPDGNSLLPQGPEGLVVAGSGRHAEPMQALIGALRELAQRPVAALNTHWQLDHLGCNGLLRGAEPGLDAQDAPAVLEAAPESVVQRLRRYLEQRQRVPAEKTAADCKAG